MNVRLFYWNSVMGVLIVACFLMVAAFFEMVIGLLSLLLLLAQVLFAVSLTFKLKDTQTQFKNQKSKFTLKSIMHEEQFEMRIRNQFVVQQLFLVARAVLYLISHLNLNTDSPFFQGLTSVLLLSTFEIVLVVASTKLF
mmetsp:Transcript_2754/g.1907  ORF Transcript_2754/g.1907 Transcript_2754/m.1907 type:complete len:139 (-) Transcript_2754:482-898(-)